MASPLTHRRVPNRARVPPHTLLPSQPQVARANVQLAHGSESPVDALPPTPAGFYDTFGNVWEW